MSKTSSVKTGEALRRKTLAFVLQWIPRRQGSPSDFIFEMEDRLGWPSRHVVVDVLNELRQERDLDEAFRKYLNYTLSEPAVRAALSENAQPGSENQSTLDELFVRSRRFRRTREFAEAVEFVSKFHEYSAFNNMLVYLQNPQTTLFATAAHWGRNFGRTIKEDARPMVILAPRTPVLLVYDVMDTEGGPLPDKFENFGKTAGRFQPLVLDRTLKNCERELIQIERKPMSRLKGGFSTLRVHNSKYKACILMRADLDEAASYAVLCHELAHLFLGHLGASREVNWPYRLTLSNPVAEIEAEAVAYIVCRRAGLSTRSVEYLANFFNVENDLSSVSFDLICRVASRIEELGRKLLTPRRQKADGEGLQ